VDGFEGLHSRQPTVCSTQSLPLPRPWLPGIEPEELHARKLRTHGFRKHPFDPVPIHDISGMHSEGEHQALGIDEHMAPGGRPASQAPS